MYYTVYVLGELFDLMTEAELGQVLSWYSTVIVRFDTMVAEIR